MTARFGEGLAVTPSIRLVRQLGRGGMGSIWLADHEGLRTRVVVKFMDPALAADPESVARFSREASSAAMVRSQHVVQTFDHGVTDDGLPFIVMELLEGKDLGDHLGEVSTMPLREVSVLVSQTAKALTRAHALGIVHRDIKPENIFLCDVGSTDIFVKLLDFGLAKRREETLTSETKTGTTMGTPFYMSPEQIVSPKHADAHADLWALSVVAFECLTGRRPFEGETVGAIAVALHSPKRPIPSAYVPTLPPEIDAFFVRAFDPSLAARFPDATTLASAFREIAALVPHAQPPIGERLKSSRRRAVRPPIDESARPLEILVPHVPDPIIVERADSLPPKPRSRKAVIAVGLLLVLSFAVCVARWRGAHDTVAAVPPVPSPSTQPLPVPASPAEKVSELPSASTATSTFVDGAAPPSATTPPPPRPTTSSKPKVAPTSSTPPKKKYVDIK